jgi:hypothetical protein
LEISGSGSRELTTIAGEFSVSDSAAVSRTAMFVSLVPAVNSATARGSVDTGRSISEFNSVGLTLGVSGGEAVCSVCCDS